MKGIITYKERRELTEELKKIIESSGLINQITHLEYPDDNEVFKWVIEYIKGDISEKIKDLKQFYKKIEKLEERDYQNKSER